MRLYFLRHGLADRGEWSGPDFERPLTHRGKAQMVRTADTIAELDLSIDLIVTSPLARAYQTAEIVADRLVMLDRLIADPRLAPGFGPHHLAEMLQAHPGLSDLMMVGHEPDFSDTISTMIGGGHVVCKKGGLARVDVPDGGWLEGDLVWLIPPKALIL